MEDGNDAPEVLHLVDETIDGQCTGSASPLHITATISLPKMQGNMSAAGALRATFPGICRETIGLRPVNSPGESTRRAGPGFHFKLLRVETRHKRLAKAPSPSWTHLDQSLNAS